MAFTDLIEIKTLLKFGLLFLPLAFYIIFIVDNTFKWKVLLTLGSFIGVAIALGGKTLGREHTVGGV